MTYSIWLTPTLNDTKYLNKTINNQEKAQGTKYIFVNLSTADNRIKIVHLLIGSDKFLTVACYRRIQTRC